VTKWPKAQLIQQWRPPTGGRCGPRPASLPSATVFCSCPGEVESPCLRATGRHGELQHLVVVCLWWRISWKKQGSHRVRSEVDPHCGVVVLSRNAVAAGCDRVGFGDRRRHGRIHVACCSEDVDSIATSSISYLLDPSLLSSTRGTWPPEAPPLAFRQRLRPTGLLLHDGTRDLLPGVLLLTPVVLTFSRQCLQPHLPE
jgi:hypothetical protein